MFSLRVDQISKRFALPDGSVVEALVNLSIAIQPAQFVIIVGPNGSGKSTLLNVLAGQYPPDSGAIYATLNRREINWTTASARTRGRLTARVHQHPSLGSVDDLTVVENLRLSSFVGMPSPLLPSVFGSRRDKIVAQLAHTPLSRKINAQAAELSQGQRQLLALEMAAGRKAQLFLLDEHTASLDRANAEATMQRTVQLSRDTQAITLMVTHDLGIARQYGDRLLVLRDGKIVADISGREKIALTISDIASLLGFTDETQTRKH